MSFQSALLTWFDKHQRALPWRKHYRPYEVWVSEIMLQQTQMETVLPYFGRWMKSFPSIEKLALADEEKVVKHWQGLGYYSRVRNLHAGAKLISDKFKGQFPSNYEDILDIKGIGRYTAGAIASIAFNQDKPVVDGNVLRVLSRVYAIDKPIDVEANKEEFWDLAEKLIPSGKARYFNQAMMELGALICTSTGPKCAVCPVSSHCKAFKAGTQENYPVKIKKKKMVRVDAACVILAHGNKYLIHQRPVGEIMGGLWEFPEWKLSKDKPLTLEDSHRQVKKLLKKEFGLSPEFKMIGHVKRNYTHHLETLRVFRVNLTENGLKSNREWPSAWTSKKDFARYPFSSAHAKIAGLI